jgi:hypothetical protein
MLSRHFSTYPDVDEADGCDGCMGSAALHDSLTLLCVAGGAMDKDKAMRGALWVSVGYNVGGAFLFAFPSSQLGEFTGLPSPVPHVYCALIAFFVLLFAGAYAWLARQPTIDRPLVALAAIGKAGVFAVIARFWLLGEAPGRGVLAATGDLILAGIFAWWLLGAQQGIHGVGSVSRLGLEDDQPRGQLPSR